MLTLVLWLLSPYGIVVRKPISLKSDCLPRATVPVGRLPFRAGWPRDKASTECQGRPQWRSNRVSSRNLPKTVIFELSAGDFRGFWRCTGSIAPAGDFPECAKARQIRPILVKSGNLAKRPDCLAGAAVMCAPVSSSIPCKKGILQGNSRIMVGSLV